MTLSTPSSDPHHWQVLNKSTGAILGTTSSKHQTAYFAIREAEKEFGMQREQLDVRPITGSGQTLAERCAVADTEPPEADDIDAQIADAEALVKKLKEQKATARAPKYFGKSVPGHSNHIEEAWLLKLTDDIAIYFDEDRIPRLSVSGSAIFTENRAMSLRDALCELTDTVAIPGLHVSPNRSAQACWEEADLWRKAVAALLYVPPDCRDLIVESLEGMARVMSKAAAGKRGQWRRETVNDHDTHASEHFKSHSLCGTDEQPLPLDDDNEPHLYHWLVRCMMAAYQDVHGVAK